MPLVRIERASPLPVDEVWRRLTHWERHAAWVPCTSITVTTPAPTRVGTAFVANTGLGRFRFADPMQVTEWQPPANGRPGHCRLVKRGSVVTGWAEITAAPSERGTSVLWLEEVRLRNLPRFLDPLTLSAGRVLFGRVVTGLLAG